MVDFFDLNFFDDAAEEDGDSFFAFSDANGPAAIETVKSAPTLALNRVAKSGSAPPSARSVGSALQQSFISTDPAFRSRPARLKHLREAGQSRGRRESVGGRQTVDSEVHIEEVEAQFGFKGHIDDAAHRGVTLPQLRTVFRYATEGVSRWRRTVKPGVKNAPAFNIDEFDHYLLNEWVVIPATKSRNCCFTELLAFGKQTPQWFVSHWWGEALPNFASCLEQHALVRELSHEAPYWMSIYALPQHTVHPSVTPDAREATFFKAMRLGDGLLVVLNCKSANNGPSTILSRLWCMYEVSLALVQGREGPEPKLLLDAVTCTRSATELLTDGLSHSEALAEDQSPGLGWQSKAWRERSFPASVLEASTALTIESGQTSNPIDRTQILNSISGNALDAAPAIEHANYGKINRVIRSAFIAMIWRQIVDRNPEKIKGMKLARALGADETREALIVNFSSSTVADSNVADLAVGFAPSLKTIELVFCACDQLGVAGRSVESLSRYYPKQLVALQLNFTNCPQIGLQFVSMLTNLMPKQISSLSLVFAECRQIADDSLERLAAGLPNKLTTLHLNFAACIDVQGAGVLELANKLPSGLTCLFLNFSGCMSLTSDVLPALGKNFPKDLSDLTLRFWHCRNLQTADAAILVQRLPESLSRLELNFLDTDVRIEKARLNLEKARQWQKELQRQKAELLRSPSRDFSALQQDKNMTVLEMSGEAFLDKDLFKLSKSFPEELEELVLDFEYCDNIGDDGVTRLAEGLPTGLVTLSLNFAFCSRVSDRGVAALAEQLPADLTHLALDFTGGAIGDKGVAAIGSALPTTLSTLRLNFSGCAHLTDEGLGVIAHGVCKSRYLEVLELQVRCCQGVTDRALEVLGHEIADCLPQLNSLVLSFRDCYQITEQGIKEVAKGLPETLYQLILDCSGCLLKSEGACFRGLAQGFQHAQELTALSLNFSDCAIGDDGIAKLCSSLPCQLTSMKLDLKHTQITDAALATLGETMKISMVKIKIVGAKNLLPADKNHSRQAADPYCICEVRTNGRRKSNFQTPVAWHSSHPCWNFTHQSTAIAVGDSLDFMVWDRDFGKMDDFLGHATLAAPDWYPDGFKGDLRLESSDHERTEADATRSPNGTLQLKIEVTPSPLGQLQTLGLICSGCQRITDHGVAEMASGLSSGLRDVMLSFHDCKEVTTKGALSVIGHLPDSKAFELNADFLGTSASGLLPAGKASSVLPTQGQSRAISADEPRKPWRAWSGAPVQVGGITHTVWAPPEHAKLGKRMPISIGQARSQSQPEESSGTRKRVVRKPAPKKVASSSVAAAMKKAEEKEPPLPPAEEGLPVRPVLILLGPLGTGKHTQAAHIADLLQLTELTEHDLLLKVAPLLREKAVAVSDLTSAGEEAEYIVMSLLQEHLCSNDCRDCGLMLEGFPRTRAQAETLHEIIAEVGGYMVVGVVVLEASEKVVLQRAFGRWVHKGSGRAYHEKFHPPKSLAPGAAASPETMLDDETGEPLVPLDDNTKDIIKRKFQMYQQETPQLLDFYADVGVAVMRVSVNFYKTDDAIWREIAPLVIHQASSVEQKKNLKPFEPNQKDRKTVQDFARWALDHWDHLYMLFEVPESNDPSQESCRPVSYDDFAEYVQKNGFKGDVKRIFRTMTAEGPVGAVAPNHISLAQVKRFSRRKSVVEAAVKDSTKEDTDLGMRFVKLLKYQHGTALRGWRLDVDLRGNGNVDYAEFQRACSRLGLGGKAKEIWASFRPLAVDAMPLTFQDVSKDEYQEVTSFMAALRKAVDFDLDEAWKILDVQGKGYLTADEFAQRSGKLGFKGDAQLLFRGLDTPGLGKLWRHELDYLKVLRKTPSRAKEKKNEKRGRSLDFRPTLRPMMMSSRKERVAFSERPAWDSTVDMTWRKNLENQSHTRAYFSDLKVKPVRSEILQKLADSAQRAADEKRTSKAA